jgi:alpha-L-fucosidase 2
MKLLFFIMLLLLSIAGVNAQQGGKLKMWYDKPATVWNEALPVGNGRLGAMVFGNPANEKIQLNESSFWSGGPSRNDNPNALGALPEVRKLIFEGKFYDAEKMINQNMVTNLHGSKYQVIGDLQLAFEGHEAFTDYYRELDLEKAVFKTTYKVNGVTYKREVFASQPDQVIVIRLSADKPQMLTFTAGLIGPLQKSSVAFEGNVLEMTGLSGTHEGVTGQVKFDARAKVVTKGGVATVENNKIQVKNANEVVILVSIATNFVDYLTLTADETAKCKTYLASCEKKNFKKLYAGHLAAYQKYFGRVSFDLGTSEAASQPTDVRIKNFSKTNDPELVAMYYQFGRYLLISSSQPGSQVANLQGIWNDKTNPMWDSKYTININTEMNYWPAEKCNLSEMHEPLIQMIKELSQTGQKTARDMYGCKGWVAHHNTDIWRITGVVDGAYWGMWPMGGAWLSQHLWEKYMYSGDKKYLESVYPVMESACQFYQDFLIEEPLNKWLVVSPGISPENNPAGRPSVCAGATMDNQIVFDIFSKTIQAATLLNKDKSVIEPLQKILDRLPPMQIGKHGQLQEWMEDLDNPNDKHRHVSHLYGLFPSNQISPSTSAELFDASRTTLIHRGDVSTGWSMGWKVNFWARLLDGNHAMKLIKDQLTLVDPVKSGMAGGTYPNFFDAHPPFQIDGNFGCTAGIAEMLLQSHDGAVQLLPALPDDWKNGEMTGLRTYGGFEVGFSWKDSKVQKIIVKSTLGGNLRLRLPNEITLVNGKALKIATGTNPNPFFETAKVKQPLVSGEAKLNALQLKPTTEYDIQTEPGKTYTFVAAK